MVRWVKRLAAVGNIIFLVALFYHHGHTGAAIIGGLLNLAWALDEWFPSQIRRFFRPWALVINPAFLAYGVLSGGPSILALLLAGSSLLAWNAGLFLERWGDAPVTIQYQYLRQIGALVALGLLAGFSAVILQGRFALLFLPVFFLMLVAGFLWLRIVSRALKDRTAG
jgi:hypothetical protein